MMNMTTVHLLEATPFDPSASTELSAIPAPFGDWAFAGDVTFSFTTGGGEALYLADGTFNSLPGDALANQHYSPVLLQPFSYEVRLFDGLEPVGRASQGFGEIVIFNGDGDLDALLALGWSGRPIMLYRAVSSGARDDATLVFSGTVDGLEPDEINVVLRLRDRQALLDRPLNASLYAGDGGAEGGEDLNGKRKPVGWGRLFNVAPPLIDSANLVYQLHDGAILAVEDVRDKGVSLDVGSNGATDYANYAALVGASISAGTYATSLAQGLIRLGGSPDGLVTVDFQGEDDGESPDAFIETAGRMVRRIVTTRLDTVNLVDPDDLDTAAFAQIEADQPAQLGFWQGPDSTLTVGQALDQILASVGAVWWFTLPGLLTVKRLDAPSGTAAEVLTPDDILQAPALTMAGGVPSYRRKVGWKFNNAVQSADDLAGAVSDADRLLYGQEYRFALTTDAAVLTQHRAAREVETRGLFALQADADTEAARLQTLHGEPRRVFPVGLVRDDPFDAPLGAVVEIQDFNRLGLSSSKKFVCIGFEANLARAETIWWLWG